MSILEQKLMALGESLRPPKSPVANYLACKRHGSTLYVSARVSRTQNKVGSDLNTDQAQSSGTNSCNTVGISSATVGWMCTAREITV